MHFLKVIIFTYLKFLFYWATWFAYSKLGKRDECCLTTKNYLTNGTDNMLLF